MPDNPLKSLTDYSRFIAELLNRPTIKHSTLSVWSDSPYTGVAEGDVFFANGLRLRIREELDFFEGIITSSQKWKKTLPVPKTSPPIFF